MMRSATTVVGCLVIGLALSSNVRAGDEKPATMTIVFGRPEARNLVDVPSDGIGMTLTVGKEQYDVTLGTDKDVEVTVKVPERIDPPAPPGVTPLPPVLGTDKYGKVNHFAEYTPDDSDARVKYVGTFTPNGEFGVGSDAIQSFKVFHIPNSAVRVEYALTRRNESGTRTTDLKVLNWTQIATRVNPKAKTRVVKRVPYGSKSEPLAAKQRVTHTHVLTNELTLHATAELEATLQARWAIVQAGIRGRVQASVTKKFGERIEKTDSIELDPARTPQAFVLYVEELTNGTIQTAVDGKLQKPIEFEYPSGFHLEGVLNRDG